MTNSTQHSPDAIFNFPDKFLWGTSTSAYQNEGGNHNTNWSEWEDIPGKIINGEKSGTCCDWWNGKWKEDFNRIEATHQNAHRFSIEWSRVQPEENRWDEDAIDHYRDMVLGLIERNITPMITLHHFTDPTWFVQKGGWENSDALLYFGKYVEKIIECLKNYCNFWITINEPNILVTMGYIEGIFPPGKKDLESAFQVMVNLIKAHSKAYEIIHRNQKNAQVGIATNFRQFSPFVNWNPFDVFIAKTINKNFNYSFNYALEFGKFNFAFRNLKIPEARNCQDFIGLNYYSSDLIKFNLLRYKKLFYETAFPINSEISENKFIANAPGGMSSAIKWARGFNKPIYITENGIEDSQDFLRSAYILEHLQKVWKATNYLIPIKGYFYWTLVDNFEWERGWTQRFGLWGLDIVSKKRFKRRSVDLYSEICRNNGFSSELINNFAPHISERILPT